MARKGIRVPREHDRVTTQGRNGVFAVVDVDNKSKTVALQTVTGNGPLLQSVPWTTLQYMDREDVN
jgi:hypothetical protein